MPGAYIHLPLVYLHGVVPTHGHNLPFTFTLFFMLKPDWELASTNRSVFLNPILTEGSNPKLKSARLM
jgi:hypothetical protein